MSATAEKPAAASVRVPLGSPVYNEVLEFLYVEAQALDRRQFDAWTGMLAEDLTYTAPLRQTRSGGQRNNDIVRTTKHFDDDYTSILGRVARLAMKSAWAEDPPSRTRRLVTNVLVEEAVDAPDEYEVVSHLLLMRSRFESPDYQQITAERRDRIRRTPEGLKLARREIIIDQAVVGMANFAVFL